MTRQKFLAVVRGPASLAPDPLEKSLLEERLDGLRHAVVNLAEDPVDGAIDHAVRAVLALWVDCDGAPGFGASGADAVAAALPWEGSVYPVHEQSRWGSDAGPPPATGTRAAGVKRMAFIVRHPQLNAQQFATHWREVHAPLARIHHPFLVGYQQNVVSGHPSRHAPAFDGIAELHFPSAEDYLYRRYDSEEGAAVLSRDTSRFLAPTGSRSVWVGEYRICEAVPLLGRLIPNEAFVAWHLPQQNGTAGAGATGESDIYLVGSSPQGAYL